GSSALRPDSSSIAVRRIGIAVLALATLAVAVGGAPASATGPVVTVSPDVGPPTSKVLVTGTGFHPKVQVQVAVAGEPVAKPKSDAAGTFTATIRIPADTAPGQRAVTATGLP